MNTATINAWKRIKKLQKQISIWAPWTKRDGILELIIVILASKAESKTPYVHAKEIVDFGFNKSTVYQTIYELDKEGIIEPFDSKVLGKNYFGLSHNGIITLRSDLNKRINLLNAMKDFTGLEFSSQTARLKILCKLLDKIEGFLFGNPVK